MPQDTYSSRRRRRTGGAPAVALSDAGTLLANWRVENTGGSPSDGVKFTSWNDVTANARHLTTANNGGLTYRAAPSGFGTCSGAEVVAGTDGLYAASQAFGGTVSQPHTFVFFAKGAAAAAWTNGDNAIGNSVFFMLGKAAGFVNCQASGGNNMFWTTGDTTVRVFTTVYTGASSTLWWNTTQNGSAGNLGTSAFTGAFGVGKTDAGNGAPGFIVNEIAVYSGDVSNKLSTVIVPYFRTKSGLALA